jgi:hypothetical protein
VTFCPESATANREQAPYLAEIVGWPLLEPTGEVRAGAGRPFLYGRKGRFKVTLRRRDGSVAAETTLAITFADFNFERMAQDRHAIWTNDPPERHLPGRLPALVLSHVAGMKEGGIRRLQIAPCGDPRERGECALIDEGGRVVVRLPEKEPTELVVALEKVCVPRLCAIVRRDYSWGAPRGPGFFLREYGCS